MVSISVQREDFDAAAILHSLQEGNPDTGAIASFIGLVRNNAAGDLLHMTLEHYPGMTEKALREIAEQARQRWTLQSLAIVHRYGELRPGEQIVMVAVASRHRQNAFLACEFIMDYLKTEAPFWKKETTRSSSHWVAARQSDDLARQRWSRSKANEPGNPDSDR